MSAVKKFNRFRPPEVAQASKQLDVRYWQFDFRDLEIQKQIGEGSFGRVRLRLPFWLACFSVLNACDVMAGGVGFQLHSGVDV